MDETQLPPTAVSPASGAPAIVLNFAAGDVLAGRYRVVGLLGRGGMGEVYRADDLELKQTVALKFLPPSLDDDRDRLERLRDEVRTARLIAHPNVCRVFDIGTASGRHYLTMEYVDGEDLASLLRRIGRLPPDKGLEISRQLCAGLAAAHDQRVIHRDLKPANVMLDGHGRVRINDFGLAVVGEKARPGDWAGTPAYMAPEQFSGGELSARTDVYALGLVLFEIFTGRRLLQADSIDQLRKIQSNTEALDDSATDINLDPAIASVIRRCVSPDPAQRPASALVVAMSLPGSDPLAAALARGETPSPSLVAASGDDVVVRKPLAIAVVAAFLIATLVTAAVSQRTSVFAALRPAYSPDVLRVKAIEMMERFGYKTSIDAPNMASGFEVTASEILRTMVADERAPLRFDRLSLLKPSVVRFWLRTSPNELAPQQLPGGSRVTPTDPPRLLQGMALVTTDTGGRLVNLEVRPVDSDEGPESGEAPWPQLFHEAGLTLDAFTPAKPAWMPPSWGDLRAAWTGVDTANAGLPLRVEAASYRGRPTYFRIAGPWTPSPGTRIEPPAATVAVFVVFLAVVALLAVSAVTLARRAVVSGRADLKGASRLAALAGLLQLAGSLLSMAHVSSPREVGLIVSALIWPLVVAVVVWLLYLALEPTIRRVWPTALVSWTRLIDGRFRDPRVCRDVLAGIGASAVLLVVDLATRFARGDRAMPIGLNDSTWQRVHSAGATLAGGLNDVTGGLFLALVFVLLYGLLRNWLRRDLIAAIVITGIFTVLPAVTAPAGQAVVEGLSVGASVATMLFVLVRFGLVASAAHIVTSMLGVTTLGLSLWYSGPSLVNLIAVSAIAGFALLGYLRAGESVPRSY